MNSIQIRALAQESRLALSEAARHLSTLTGTKVSVSRIYRWITRGVGHPLARVVRLQAAKVGGRWVTSKEAIDRFLADLGPVQQTPVI
jgi:hypothetical protein